MKGQMLKLFVVTIAFLLLTGACAAPPPLLTPTPVPPTSTPVPPTPNPAAPVQAWVDALNSGDVDATLALFADDLKFDVFEYHARNKDELRGIFDWLAGLETKYQIKECQTKDDQVVCTMPVSDACIAGYDPVAGLMSNMTFVSQQDGKIAQVNGMPDGFDDYYAKWISPGTTWMRANRAEELAKVESTSDGREAGAIQTKLCREYGESLKATPAATSDLTAPVQAWVDAMNSGDVDAALTLFADDGKYQLYYDARGKEQIRSVFDWLAGLETKSQLADCQPKSDRVVCNYIVRDACMAAFGTDGLPVKATFVIQDGKVKQAIGYGKGSEWDSYWKFVDAETAWAAVNRAEEWAKFRPLSKEFAPVAVKLCKEYAESLKATPVATSDLTAPVQAWADALNSGDVDATLALFTDDVKFSVFEYFASNKDGLRGIFDWLAGLETKYQVTECQPKDGGVVCTMPVVDACIAGFGATDGLPTKMEFSFQADGKISKVSGNLEGGEWNNYFSKWVYPATGWKQTNRAEEMAKANTTTDAREAGAINAKLCKEYGESLKATPVAAKPSAATGDQLKVIQAYYAALNSGDVDAALALFTDDVKFRGENYATGKEMLRGVFDWLAGTEVKHGPPDCQSQNDRVVCAFSIGDACIAASGATDGLPAHGEYLIQSDGKIREASESLGGAGWDAYIEWDNSFQGWAMLNRAEEWRGFGHSKEFAPRLAKLCKEYAVSLK